MNFKILSDQDTEITCFVHICNDHRLQEIKETQLFDDSKPVASCNAKYTDPEKFMKLDDLVKKLR